jgi:hypothetical protein
MKGVEKVEHVAYKRNGKEKEFLKSNGKICMGHSV